jgi:hypothetical protein
MIFPSYRLLIESYAKAQEVEKQHERGKRPPRPGL